MATTTCSRCGNFLPAVGMDPRHPDWCPMCVARANGEVGPPTMTDPRLGLTVAVPPRPALALATAPVRLLEGTLLGVAAAALGAASWWALCTFSERQFTFVAIVVGLLVGQAVLIGTRRTSVGGALVAALAAAAAFATSEYFVQRSLAVRTTGATIPLWQGFGFAKDVVEESRRTAPTTGLFWAVGIVAAIVSAAAPGRHPLV